MVSNKKEYFDCVAYVTDLFFKQVNRDILPLYLSGFGFKYKKSKTSNFFDAKIISSNKMSHQTLLSLSGMSKKSVVFDRGTFINDLFDYVNHNKLLGVYIDSFYCPWNKYYLKIHRDHCVAVIGGDIYNRSLQIYDGYLSDQVEHLPIDLFKLGYIRSFIYSEKRPQKPLNASDALKFIYDFSCDSFEERVSHIMEFHSDVETYEFNNIICDSKLELSSLCMSLSYLLWNRMGLKNCLTNSIPKNEVCHLDLLVDLLEINTLLWSKYRYYFIKYLFQMSNMHKEILSKTIYSIIDNELSVIDYLIDRMKIQETKN